MLRLQLVHWVFVGLNNEHCKTRTKNEVEYTNSNSFRNLQTWLYLQFTSNSPSGLVLGITIMHLPNDRGRQLCLIKVVWNDNLHEKRWRLINFEDLFELLRWQNKGTVKSKSVINYWTVIFPASLSVKKTSHKNYHVTLSHPRHLKELRSKSKQTHIWHLIV